MEAAVERYRETVTAHAIEALASEGPFPKGLDGLLPRMTEPSGRLPGRRAPLRAEATRPGHRRAGRAAVGVGRRAAARAGASRARVPALDSAVRVLRDRRGMVSPGAASQDGW